MRKLLIATSALLLLMLLTDCTANYKIVGDGTVETNNSADATTEDLKVQSTTDASGLEEGDIGFLGAGLTNWPKDDNGKRISYEYNGGEIEADFVVKADGLVDNVGVLLYLDAKPVPYKLKSYDDETSYFHLLEDISNKGDVNYKAVFTPSGFTKGEMATLTIAFIYCADYIYDPSDQDVVINADLSVLSSNWLPANGDIHFNVDVPKQKDQIATPFVKNVKVTMKKDINTFLDEMNAVVYKGSDFKLTAADLDGDFPYFVKYYDNDLTYSGTICTTGKKTVHIKYKVAGPEGIEVKWGFSLGYQPTFIDGEPTFTLVLHKGEYYIVEMDMDVSAITQPTKLLCELFTDNELYEVTPIILYPDSTQSS